MTLSRLSKPPNQKARMTKARSFGHLEERIISDSGPGTLNYHLVSELNSFLI